MTACGLTLPNYMWHAWSEEELAAVVDLRPDVLVVLLYAREIPASQEKWGQLRDLLIACPSIRRLQVRPYSDRIQYITDYGWAAECWNRLVPYLRMRPGVEVELIPANEINLESGHSDWDRHAAWLISFAEAWGSWDVGQQVPLHLPALSPGVPGYREGWARFATLDVSGAYDIVDVHCYGGESARDYAEIHAHYPDFPISVTEMNQVHPGEFLASLPDYVLDASWFILAGEEDQQPYWLMGGPWYASYKSYTHREETGTMTLAEQYPSEYVAWTDGNGVENAFRAHLMGIGVLPADIEALAVNVESAWTQLRTNLPKD